MLMCGGDLYTGVAIWDALLLSRNGPGKVQSVNGGGGVNSSIFEPEESPHQPHV